MHTESDDCAIRSTAPMMEPGRALTRRTLLRRSALGAAGAGLALLLAACGDENEEPATGGGAGSEDTEDSPDGTAETGI